MGYEKELEPIIKEEMTQEDSAREVVRQLFFEGVCMAYGMNPTETSFMMARLIDKKIATQYVYDFERAVNFSIENPEDAEGLRDIIIGSIAGLEFNGVVDSKNISKEARIH